MDEHKITADTTPLDSDPIPQEMPSKVPDHGEVTRFRESYFIEEFEEDEQLNEGHATAVFSTSEEDSLEEDTEDEATDPPLEGTASASSEPDPEPSSAKRSHSARPKKTDAGARVGKILGYALSGVQEEGVMKVFLGSYRWVFVSIAVSMVFNISLHYILSGQLEEVDNLQKELNECTLVQQSLTTELTKSMTKEQMYERLKQYNMTLAPADSAPYIIYVPIPKDLRDE
ncbi:MAG: hypothetical protein PUI84_06785 [Bacteroidales bacterium]|nr:hypothetical protein [Porphyromonas sp.]MDD6935008.1 hypothetical protein [Bacteroidales bacterium]MDY3102616.1 hypothetical protein [Porphyromonas sp.]